MGVGAFQFRMRTGEDFLGFVSIEPWEKGGFYYYFFLVRSEQHCKSNCTILDRSERLECLK